MYRLSHSLAHNDCVMRMESEYGVLLDIDEYIHIPSVMKITNQKTNKFEPIYSRENTTLLEFAKREFTIDPKLGSLLFWHSGLKVREREEWVGKNEVFLLSDYGCFSRWYFGSRSCQRYGTGKSENVPDLSTFEELKQHFQTLFKPDNVMFLSTHWVLSHSRYGLKRKKVKEYSLLRRGIELCTCADSERRGTSIA